MTQTAFALSPLNISQNQQKVIKDKYLRPNQTVEAWLYGVAFNIALAELLQSHKAKEWGVFEGVSYTELPAKGALSKTLLFHKPNETEEKDANFSKLISNLEHVYNTNNEAMQMVKFWVKEFYDMMAAFDFLPNSPTLMNAGRDLQQLSACYVLPVPDSIEGITKSLQAQSLIQKSGGGTGFSFGRLRAKGSIVKKTSGVASGALSFMQLFDKMTDVVKQGGTRRGANMGVLPYNHPEILDFIKMKDANNCMENFNVSVAIDKNFLDAVKENREYDLINPYDGISTGKINAKQLFDTISASAWKSGDPGVIFLDRMNEPGSNPTPHLGAIESTNPCGEQPLLPWEPCNLGSINLSNFVKGELTQGKMDFDTLGKTVQNCVRFLDNVIEINNYPLAEIEKMAKTNRRIGLGVMGLSEAFVKMGLAYDSEGGLKMAEDIMTFINNKAVETSCTLAVDRGVFPNFEGSVYDKTSKYFAGKDLQPRHSARTTIAPTGTIAITAGLQGSGIEPFFAIAYTRYNARALEALKNGQTPEAGDVFFEVNPLFKELAKKHNYFGISERELWAKIDKNHKAVRGIKDIPAAVQALFPTAHDVSIEGHIKMQAAFQRHVDNAVSKTINMNNNATVDDIKKAYMLSYELGCKGITIYRDGSKSQQVLNTTAITQKPKEIQNPKREKPFGVSSHYYEVQTGYGPLHVHINYDEQGPYQVFTSIAPIGTEISGLTSLVGILLSKYLAQGGDPIKILKHLNSIKGDRPIGFGANHINSIAHGISTALKSHLAAAGGTKDKLEAEDKLTLWDASKAQYCPKCYSSNISFEGGCSGPTCHDCGYSKCS